MERDTAVIGERERERAMGVRYNNRREAREWESRELECKSTLVGAH